MNLSCKFEHLTSPEPLIIDVQLSNANQILFEHRLNLNKSCTDLLIDFSLKNLTPQKLKLSFATTNHSIVDHPLTITKIVLDDFHSIGKILYSGHSKFDDNFLIYAKSNQIMLEENICDTNCINFTGKIEYYFDWPFYKNVFTNFRPYQRNN